MHGGARGSGGPKGQRNGNYKHGRYTAETVAVRRWVKQCIREVNLLARSLRAPLILRANAAARVPPNGRRRARRMITHAEKLPA
jgi:hypothetical protein